MFCVCPAFPLSSPSGFGVSHGGCRHVVRMHTLPFQRFSTFGKHLTRVRHGVGRRVAKDTTHEGALRASPPVSILRQCVPWLLGRNRGCELNRVVPTPLRQEPTAPAQPAGSVVPTGTRVADGLHPARILRQQATRAIHLQGSRAGSLATWPARRHQDAVTASSDHGIPIWTHRESMPCSPVFVW